MTTSLDLQSREHLYRHRRDETSLIDHALHPNTIARGISVLAARHGQIARTPDVTHEFEAILERRATSDRGDEGRYFVTTYATESHKDLAQFHGIINRPSAAYPDTVEEPEAAVDRILAAAVDEMGNYIPGIVAMQTHYDNEIRVEGLHGDHAGVRNADLQIFRNTDNGWASIDVPSATSDKHTSVQMYSGPSEPGNQGRYFDTNVYQTATGSHAHPGWA